MFYTYLFSALTTPAAAGPATANGVTILENSKPKLSPFAYIAIALTVIALGIGVYLLIKK